MKTATGFDFERAAAFAERRVRLCVRKVPYRSEIRARHAIEGMQRRKVKTAAGLEPYDCMFCGSWHIGHPNGAPWEA